MRSAVTKAVLVLLICTCIVAQVPEEKQSEINSNFDCQEQQTVVELEELPFYEVPYQIFDELTRPEGKARDAASNAAFEVFSRLISFLARRNLIVKTEFKDINSLDFKARLRLISKLEAALDKVKLQSLRHLQLKSMIVNALNNAKTIVLSNQDPNKIQGEFRIVALNGHVLDIYGGLTASLTPVISHPWHGGANQRWRWNNGMIESVLVPGRVLDIEGGVGENKRLIIYDKHGGANQRFAVSPEGYLTVAHLGLAIKDAARKDWSNIIALKPANAWIHFWRLVPC